MMLSAKKKKMKVVVQTCYDDVMPAFYNTSQIAAESGTLIEHLSTEVPLWCPANPVLLDLPTGSGKTTFVYQVLLSEAMARGKNLLLVSNRIALSSQQKLAIMEVLDDPRKKLLTEEGVRLTEDFGCVRVITYHRLPALLHDQSAKDWIANLCYVVLDECHFFAADAVFNERADYYLRLVCEKFCHAVRVYLTATSWDVLVPLAQAELKYYRPRVPMCVHPFVRECHRYTMPVSYDSYALHFFDELDELVDKIAGNISEKWVIFVDNKDRGKHFLDACKKKSISCTYLDADSKGSTSWKHIVKNAQFEEQVLITTAVLDNGININDDAVKNVAIMTDNRVSFVQMLGRKRMKRGERVHVWVRNLPMKTITARYQQYAAWHDWYRYVEQCAKQEHDYIAKKLWNHEDATLRKLFHLHDGVLYPDELAKCVIVRRETF